jgi:hypothetical protein
MSGVRSMLARVQRLEQARTAPRSLFEAAWGSLDAFEADTQAEIDAGMLCGTDMPIIIACIKRWHKEEVFDGWKRDRIWEYAR